MSLTLFTPPADEPVTLEEARIHLRVTYTEQDSVITQLIKTARQWAEEFTGRAFLTQTWDWKLERFPEFFDVPRPPLQSVTSIKYIDTNGTEQTLAASEYTVDSARDPGRIVPAYGKSWPPTRGHINDVTVRFVAGYGASGAVMPAAIVNALKLQVEILYDRSDSNYLDAIVGARDALLGLYRVHKF